MLGIDEVTINCEQQSSKPTSAQGVSVCNYNSASNDNSCTTRFVRTSQSPKASFQGAVLSTVYKEKQLQESRNKNFVVTGLTVSTEIDDKTAVEQICQKELNVTPENALMSSSRQNHSWEGSTSAGYCSFC